MPRRVVLSGEFGTDDVDVLCAALAPLTSLTEPEQVTIDMLALEGVSASALAVLISVLRTVHVDGRCDPLAALTAPREPGLHRWLDAENLQALLEHPAEGYPGMIERAFSGCEPFSGINGIMRAREALLAWISERTGLGEEAQSTVRKLVWDLAQNVLVHAEIGGGIATARVDSRDATLELAVADCGIGIRESLVRGELPDVGDDASAVMAALRPGVTSDPGSGKGMGLYLAKRVLARNKGSLIVRSGNARVDEPTRGQVAVPLRNFKGTLVTVIARLDGPLDYEAVDRELLRPEGVAS
jgi:anti-sigma regulatory factor (Ser/Thr protein kinase)/ABC-type transporter Mla MlaB component